MGLHGVALRRLLQLLIWILFDTATATADVACLTAASQAVSKGGGVLQADEHVVSWCAVCAAVDRVACVMLCLAGVVSCRSAASGS
jgi:hypothetical protein